MFLDVTRPLISLYAVPASDRAATHHSNVHVNVCMPCLTGSTAVFPLVPLMHHSLAKNGAASSGVE